MFVRCKEFLLSPDRVLYVGESLGAAVVTELATAHPPAGLVLRSPFIDLAAVGAHHYPVLPVRLRAWAEPRSEVWMVQSVDDWHCASVYSYRPSAVNR